jgi:hypothetical protein
VELSPQCVSHRSTSNTADSNAKVRDEVNCIRKRSNQINFVYDKLRNRKRFLSECKLSSEVGKLPVKHDKNKKSLTGGQGPARQ